MTNQYIKEIQRLKKKIVELKDENALLKARINERSTNFNSPAGDELIRLTFDNALDGICIGELNEDGCMRILDVNHAALENHGYTLEEVQNRSLQNFHSKSISDTIAGQISQLLAGKSFSFTSSCLQKNGNEILLEISSRVVRIQGVPYIYIIEKDVTEKQKVINQNKLSLEALQESEENYRLLFHESPLAMYVSNPDGEILDANKTLLNLLGSPSLEATKKINILKFQPLIDVNYAEKYREAYNTGKPIKFDVYYQSKWGKAAYISSTIAPIKNKEGEYDRIYTVMEDITQRKNIEDALIKSKEELQRLNKNLEDIVAEEVEKNREKDRMMIIQAKQAAMGDMIGNIAHQWRQPLNDIGLSIQDLQDSYEFNEFSEEALNSTVEHVMDRLQYMSRTIDDFRNFFRSDKEKVLFSLSHAIHHSFSLVRASYKNSFVNSVLSINKDVFYKGYLNEFSQAVLNILNNARDVLVERKVEKPLVKLSLETKENKIYIKIANNGGEISDEIIDKIFEPYFTTKEKVSGTGLGLYISKTIIERNMGGELSVHNTTDGVVFVIVLDNNVENDE